MVSPPDLKTLALCDALSSLAFVVMFFVIWAGQRHNRYLLHWGCSGACYAVALIWLQVIDVRPSPFVIRLLLILVPLSDLLILSGVRAFYHRRPFHWWMVVPPLLTAAVLMLPGPSSGTDQTVRISAPGQEAMLAVLAMTKIIVGGLLVFRPGGRLRGGRIAGGVLLAYVPAYVIAMIADRAGMLAGLRGPLLPLLGDQLLLPLLNLGLLWMPGERASRELHEGALRDPLTGAWNRRWLDRHRARLARAGTAVILMDVDHFKHINDRHGHAAGDAVLLSFSRKAAGLLDRANGYMVRLGGDEFLALVPAASPHGARRMAEELRLSLVSDEPGVPAATASVGVAILAAGATLSEAMAQADQSLYHAKAAGRDRVEMAARAAMG